MWPWLLAALGFGLAAKSKTRTNISKLSVLGPRSGETWDAELFPEARLAAVYSRRGDRTVAFFDRDPKTRRFTFKQGKGSPTILGMMREDFEGEKPPL